MKPTLFIDRDGTLIDEPADDFQVDSLEKLRFKAEVIPALLQLQQYYRLVMVSNQDGLGTPSFPQEAFDKPHQAMMQLFISQGIHFDEVLICPHFDSDDCNCRKPKVALLQRYIDGQWFDLQRSFVIGDRASDMQLAENLGITGLLYDDDKLNWRLLTEKLLADATMNNKNNELMRYSHIVRQTKETNINVQVWLDKAGVNEIHTGIGFFDHMLDQIATHAGFKMILNCQGDLWIDEHHSIEDTAIALGQALKEALGDKRGIGRFGFVLPMDESCASCQLDLSGRPFIKFKGKFRRDKVGDFPTEMTEHFFGSLAFGMMATVHLSVKGNNDHHKVESLFKVFGRALRQAIRQQGDELPSSKGVL